MDADRARRESALAPLSGAARHGAQHFILLSFSLLSSIYRARKPANARPRVMRALKPLFSPSLLRAIRPAAGVGRKLSGTSPLSSAPAEIVSNPSSNSGRRLSSVAETLMEYERDQPRNDAVLMEKEATLQLALSKLVGDFDRDSHLSLCRFFSTRRIPTLSTGSLKLDLALGIGGLPKGRMVEIYGKEASGKTTLALHIVKEAQKHGGYCAFLDIENALNPSLVEAMGIDPENLLVAHPNSAEKSLSIVDTLVSSSSVDVIVVDSVAALIPQCEIDGTFGVHSREAQSQSRLMTQALRKIHYSLCRSQALVIFINQVRMNQRASQNFSEVTCGGNALKFFAAVRMRATRRGLLHTENEVTGINIAVEVVKNKLAPPKMQASLDIRFGIGICHEAEVLEMASKHGIISKVGNGYLIQGELLKDQREAEQYLASNSAVSDELVDILRDQMFDTAT